MLSDLPLIYTDSLDTTVKLKFSLKTYPSLTSAESIAALLSRFGATDIDSIVLSIKPTKKQPDKPPKYGTALVPFKQIGNAFAAVCGSGRKELGLDGVEITWVGGKEPAILGWLKRMGKLGTSGSSNPSTVIPAPTSESPFFKNAEIGGTKADLPQNQSRATASGYSSFPSTFVRSFSSAGYHFINGQLFFISARYWSTFTCRSCAIHRWYRLRICNSHAYATSGEGETRTRDSGTRGQWVTQMGFFLI